MKDSTNEKKTYAPPQLTVVTFKMEQGFTASNELTGTNSVILGEWLFGNNSQGECGSWPMQDSGTWWSRDSRAAATT